MITLLESVEREWLERETERQTENEKERETENERERESKMEREREIQKDTERESKRKGVNEYEREPVRERGRSSARDLKESLNGRARYRKSKEDRRRGHAIHERDFYRPAANHRCINNKHQEDPWIQVGGRRKARLQKRIEQGAGPRRQNNLHAHLTSEKHRPLSWRNKKDIISFYFSHFPESVNETYLWKLFQEWGKVWEVFIPKSKNKQGQRYGFVRFKGVEDEGRLKLFVNKPKF